MNGVFLFLFLFGTLITKSQTVSTIAGNGTAGHTGDGGMATLASLGGIGGIECDNSGNIYIASYNNTVRKISTSGIITTVAGNGTAGFSGDGGLATSAQLNFSGAWMSVDTAGNIYIADFANHRIRKVTRSTGIISTIAGNGIAGFSGDGTSATTASLNSPTYMCTDASGNLYIGDYSNYRIRKINTMGIISTFAGKGTPGFSGDGGAATNAELFGTCGLCNDKYGNLYFSDNNRIRRIDISSGIITTVAGNGSYGYSGDGGAATAAGLNSPKDVVIDSRGNIYLADRVNNRIRVVDSSGIINTVIGNGVGAFSGDGNQAAYAQIHNPQGITFDECGNLLIVDNGNFRIRKVTFNPPPCTYLSVEEQANPKPIVVYPNPINEELHIDNVKENSTYQLCNIVGAVMERGYLKTGNNSIAVQQLPPGMYMLVVTDEEGKRMVHKIVKE